MQSVQKSLRNWPCNFSPLNFLKMNDRAGALANHFERYRVDGFRHDSKFLNSGEPPSQSDISRPRLCIEVKFSENLEETCICNLQMIIVHFSFFSLSHGGKTYYQGWWYASTYSTHDGTCPYKIMKIKKSTCLELKSCSFMTTHSNLLIDYSLYVLAHITDKLFPSKNSQDSWKLLAWVSAQGLLILG